MKNKVLLICAGFLLLIFLMFGTYMWYIFFLQMNGVSMEKDITNNTTKSGDVVFKDDGYGIREANARSIDDSQLDKVKAYYFQVENNKNKSSEYTLYIEDLPANAVDDGCTEDTLLNRQQLKYQLSLNDKVIKEDYMLNIKDNILDKREIEGSKTNNYSLKIYIYDGAIDWVGKHYHYKVSLGK